MQFWKHMIITTIIRKYNVFMCIPSSLRHGCRKLFRAAGANCTKGASKVAEGIARKGHFSMFFLLFFWCKKWIISPSLGSIALCSYPLLDILLEMVTPPPPQAKVLTTYEKFWTVPYISDWKSYMRSFRICQMTESFSQLKTCVPLGSNRKWPCTCDKNDNVWRYEEGIINVKDIFPIINFIIADTNDSNEKSYLTVGPLTCKGKISFLSDDP